MIKRFPPSSGWYSIIIFNAIQLGFRPIAPATVKAYRGIYTLIQFGPFYIMF